MAFKQGHALVIGVGAHQHHPRLDVPIAVDDAEAVADVLRDPNACGYPAGQIRPLHRSDATKDGILSALDELAARASLDDTVFIFYCGHGAVDRWQLLPGQPRRGGEAAGGRGTGVSEELLQNSAHRRQARA
jgi:hypothetical protein